MSNLLELKDESPNAPIERDRSELEQRMKNGANWFYWIAGLSLVNSLLFLAGTQVSFLGGLGISLVIDALVDGMIEAGGPTFLRIVAVVNLAFVAGFAFFGYYAGKRFGGAFVLGIILYLLDSILVLLFGDYLMAAFHAFALFFIIRGYLACRGLTQ